MTVRVQPRQSRVVAAALLLVAGAAESILEVLNLHDMPDAGIGWFWDAYHSAPWPWVPWLVIAHLVLVVGIIAGSRLALWFAVITGSVLATWWLWLTVYYGSKMFRLDGPEPYLLLIPLSLAIAYSGLALASAMALRPSSDRHSG